MTQINKCNCQCGCEAELQKASSTIKKTMIISWQRLVDDGHTCPRCGSTESELDDAVQQLKEKLASLEIDVIFEKKELSLEEFTNNPVASNCILFNGRSLEDIIGAKIGKSQCCEVCGDEECRTTEIGSLSLEVIPSVMIVKAGLKMAIDL